jgi:hypothetical protein
MTDCFGARRMACWVPRGIFEPAAEAMNPQPRRSGGQVSADPTRRVVLTAAAGAAAVPLLAGCKGIGALGPLPKTAADVITLDHAITAEKLMVARYQATLSAMTGRPKTETLLRTLLTEHQAHLDQLRSRLILPPRLATVSPAPSPASPAGPTGREALIAELATAEHAASARLTRQLLDVPPALAQLMASIAASEAAHVVVLHQAGRA